jgi:mono/diheme cytochrome c family protein
MNRDRRAIAARRGCVWPCLSFAISALLFAGCGNMKRQEYLRSDSPMAFLPHGTSTQPPPPNTVAYNPGRADARLTTFTDANGKLVDALPMPVTSELLERGRERFTIYCSVCHGEDGYGRGIVVQRGFPAPPSFHDARLRNAPIGHLFSVMTHGYGLMYAYADRLAPEDRWAVAAYIRVLQLSQHARVADLAASDRAALAALTPTSTP